MLSREFLRMDHPIATRVALLEQQSPGRLHCQQHDQNPTVPRQQYHRNGIGKPGDAHLPGQTNAPCINPALSVLRLSAYSGEGLSDWYAWLRHEHAACARAAA